jgi:molecular chaperone DnaJ
MIRPDFYGVLGVSPVASAEEIRQAYYHLARQHHPDAKAGQIDGERF